MRNLDLDALQIFKAVADEGGVARAAAQLNRVQSNVSTRLKQLEAALDAPLFRRQNRRLVLSDQGRVLLSYADRLLRLSAEAQQAVRDGAPRGTLRLGTMEHGGGPVAAGAGGLPRGLAAGAHRAGHGTSAALAAKVRDYELEAAFVAEPFPAEGLASTEAFAETLVLISPRAWPEIADARALADHTVIAFASGCSYRRILESWLGREGVAPGKVMEFASYHAIVACVAAGTGVAIVPRSVLDVLGGQTALRVRDLPGKYGAARTRLVWRVDDDTPAVQELRDQLAA